MQYPATGGDGRLGLEVSIDHETLVRVLLGRENRVSFPWIVYSVDQNGSRSCFSDASTGLTEKVLILLRRPVARNTSTFEL